MVPDKAVGPEDRVSVADGFPVDDLPAGLRYFVEGRFGVCELLAELHELGAIH